MSTIKNNTSGKIALFVKGGSKSEPKTVTLEGGETVKGVDLLDIHSPFVVGLLAAKAITISGSMPKATAQVQASNTVAVKD